MSVTVSWDGPQSVHDVARPTRTGGSSFSVVRRTVERLQSAGIPVEVECTYTARHLDAGLSVADMMEYFYRTAGVERVHIPPVTPPAPLEMRLPSGTLALLYAQAARLTVDNVFRLNGPILSTALDIIERIATKNPALPYCPAFFRQLSVGEDGALYPCFMFIDDPAFYMGNVLEDAFPSESSARVIARYFREFGAEPTGTRRWYGALFGGCIASDYFATGTLGPHDENVRVAMIQQCLFGVARNRRALAAPSA